MTDFVHLAVHSEYSLVDGLIRIQPVKSQRGDRRLQPLAERVRELGQGAVALTDRDNLFAMAKFYKAAEGQGIKPLLGVDLALRDDDDSERRPLHRVTVLIRNQTGLANAMKLVSRMYTERSSEARPSDAASAQRDWLLEHGDGLIVLSGRGGDVGQALLAGDVARAEALLTQWRERFGDAFYLALARCDRPGDEAHVRAAVALARRHGVPVVAVNDVCFLDREDFDAHEARVCILQGRTLDDPRRSRDYSPEQYLKSAQEMQQRFADLPEALANSVEIARRCTVELQFGTNYLPDFPVPEGRSVAEHLRLLSEQGLADRLRRHGSCAPEAVYRERLEEELGIIEQMGFPGYFLIVADFIQWAKDHQVPVGPGRGSGAGSLVAYAIGITDLDPLVYNLLFERFLNPERVSMPDFDVDFCMEGRDRVIDYVTQKYGPDHVGQIITYGSMAARAVVRDVTRVMGQPHGFGDRIAKMIPGAPSFKVEAGRAGATELEYALQSIPELRQAYEEEDVKAILDLGLLLEGLARNIGKHAGGVVIAPGPLTDYVPLYRDPEAQGVVTQLDMKDLEAIGLVKFDFLGLRTLTIIQWAVDIINRDRDEPLDILSIPKDDPGVYALFSRGETAAIFQMESAGMRRLAMELQPSRFEDLVALVALFRPGPLQSGMVTDFINRKHGREKVRYPHPALENVLEETYGVIVYQEQVMRIARELAGYSLGGADLLRRAMGKKKADEMARQQEIFVSGARERGVEQHTAVQIFELIQKFAEYGFNKSHSAAYALVAYQTAWLKAHHPAAFMCAVLSAEMFKTDTLVGLVDECRAMGLTVLPPDVNRSDFRFRVTGDGAISYGLGAIRGVGEGAVDSIREAREDGPFANLFDFCRRVDPRRVNKRVFEALIQAGAFDSLGVSRAVLWHNLSRAVAAAEQSTALADAGQSDLFGFGDDSGGEEDTALELIECADWDALEHLQRERDALGFYLSGHPLESYRTLVDHLGDGRLRDLCERLPDSDAGGNGGNGGNGYRRGVRVSAVGWLADIRKFGARAMLTLDDRSTQVSVPLSEEQWMRHASQLRKDSLLLVQGRLSPDEFTGGFQIRPSALYDLDAIYAGFAARVELYIPVSLPAVDELLALIDGARAERGAVLAVSLSGSGATARMRFDAPVRISLSDALVRRLQALLGEDAVRITWT